MLGSGALSAEAKAGGQIVALVIAVLLLLPGGCFLLFGIGLRDGWPVTLIALAIFALAGLLFWLAFRRRPEPENL